MTLRTWTKRLKWPLGMKKYEHILTISHLLRKLLKKISTFQGLKFFLVTGSHPHIVKVPMLHTKVFLFNGFNLLLVVPDYPVEVLNLEKEYDLDSDDEVFLEGLKIQKFLFKDGTEFGVDEDIFETIIDHLEKQSFDEVCNRGELLC